MILVTGSTDGIGLRTAASLVAAGHQVVVHARDEGRAATAKAALPGAHGVVMGDLTSLRQTRQLAAAAAAFGPYHAVIHNAGISRMSQATPLMTEDGLEATFQVNVVASYLLTALLPPPQRLVFVSSAMAADGVIDLERAGSATPWDGVTAYCTSKLYVLMLAFAVARHWPDVSSNASDPGWVRTKMGGSAAPSDVDEGAEPQIQLVTAAGSAGRVTGTFLTRRDWQPGGLVVDPMTQDALLARLATLTGVTLPPRSDC